MSEKEMSALWTKLSSLCACSAGDGLFVPFLLLPFNRSKYFLSSYSTRSPLSRLIMCLAGGASELTGNTCTRPVKKEKEEGKRVSGSKRGERIA